MESAWPQCMSAPCPTCSPSPLWLLHECLSSTVTASVRPHHVCGAATLLTSARELCACSVCNLGAVLSIQRR